MLKRYTTAHHFFKKPAIKDCSMLWPHRQFDTDIPRDNMLDLLVELFNFTH